MNSKSSKIHYARVVAALSLSTYALWCTLTPNQYRFLDGVDLLFHEAGHLFLTPFGQWLHMLGGTVGQLVFPITCVVVFARRHDLFAVGVVMFWVGQNFYNISRYMRDAMAMQLPLVGGGTHDWNWMFSRLGLLKHAELVGWLTFAVGVACVLLSIWLMVITSLKPKSNPIAFLNRS